MQVRALLSVWGVASLCAFGCGDDAGGTPGKDAGSTPRDPYGRDAGQCGDGVLDRGEDCDGIVIGQSCESLGLERGPLGCTSRCTLDTSRCGDNPRPPPPERPDASLFPQPIPDVTLVCEEIVRCGDVALPVKEDGVSELVIGDDIQAFCVNNIDALCLECVAGEVSNGQEFDNDAGSSCDSECEVACFGLSVSRLPSLLAPGRCAAAAADFFDGFDAACLCDQCATALSDCLNHVQCYEALLCIDRTGCSGNACAEDATCRKPIRALSFSSSTVGLDTVRQCIDAAGCRAP